jgi:uncharacterized protein YciI
MEILQVVLHTPGPKWKKGIDFREQPGVMDHVSFYSKLQENGKLKMGGPYLDVDSGGMMVASDDVSRKELEELASKDPAIVTGLLHYEVRSWYIAMK